MPQFPNKSRGALTHDRFCGPGLGAFDRRKEGELCPEGWKLTPFPGPQFRTETGSAEASYYTWVDQFNTSGLGTNVPLVRLGARRISLSMRSRESNARS